jgi:integrase
MKIKTLQDVKFYPEKRHKKDENGEKILVKENVPIMAAFSYDKKRLTYYTGERIDLNKWDYEAQRVKRNNFQNNRSFKDINNNLDTIASAIFNIYSEYKNKQIPFPDVKTFRKDLKERLGENTNEVTDRLSFLAKKFLETSGGGREWTKGTRQKIKATTNHLIDAVGDIQVRDINENTFATMQKYFYNEGMVNNTIKKNLKVLKWFFRWLIKHDYITGKAATGILNYQPKIKDISETQRQKKNLIALTKDEIETLENVEIPETKNYLERVRDVFLFQCFTGLRYSDLYALKKHNIIEKNGATWLNITTQKDSEFLEYKLIPQAVRIIEKYKDYSETSVLPVITNQRMNEYLKELGKLAELNDLITKVHYRGNTKEEDQFPKWQLLTTHVGRKTFITTAVEAGVPMDELMRIVGHSDFEMLKVYYTVRDERLSSAMDKIGGYYG